MSTCNIYILVLSALTLLVGWRKGIRTVKKLLGCWHGYLSGARCRLADSAADANATHCLLLQQNPDWFYLSGTGLPGISEKGPLNTCVCVYFVDFIVFVKFGLPSVHL